jgi:hypothetical protein
VASPGAPAVASAAGQALPADGLVLIDCVNAAGTACPSAFVSAPNQQGGSPCQEVMV